MDGKGYQSKRWRGYKIEATCPSQHRVERDNKLESRETDGILGGKK